MSHREISCRADVQAMPRADGERGLALLVVLMALALLLALGSALVLATTTETRIGARHRDGAESFHAADAALARALVDLDATADWRTLPSGGMLSTFTDGPPAGVRALPRGGGVIDLTGLTNQVRCGRRVTCSEADMDRATAERPWGRNNPRWQLYAFGPLAALLPDDSLPSSQYVVVWIADDPSETDDDPLVDGGPPADDPDAVNPGWGLLRVLAHAYGPGGAHRAVEALVRQTDRGVRIETWVDGRR